MGNPLVVISVKVSTNGPLNAHIKTLMKSVVWSMKLFSKIVVKQSYKYYYPKLSLDSGASSIVCGTHWFNEYTESLSAQDCSKPFRFGDGKPFVASKVANSQHWTSQTRYQNSYCQHRFLFFYQNQQ